MRTRREQERTDAGKEGCRKLRKGRLKREEKERREAGKERIQERKNAGKRDAGEKRFRKGVMQERRDTVKVWMQERSDDTKFCSM